MTFIKINSFVNDRDIMTNASNKEFTNAEVDIKHFANMHNKNNKASHLRGFLYLKH
ncbi:hypothetical protein VSP10_12615 [Myroides odoratimimus]|uniref:hypothetical protein n=1 Tax=Myroides odoratimimus TaxID=76832 RepID=UPI002DBB6EBE|nr:hypothetical protein [Myroides odoratimimus]MEC4053630.1 hypothetical protein [Myroides odoratimimus]